MKAFTSSRTFVFGITHHALSLGRKFEKRVITDSADLVTREATQQKRDNVTILSVHLVYCRFQTQIY